MDLSSAEFHETLPLPALPRLNLEKVQAVMPNAISFALLGAIESLLSAVVADNMTGRRHRSNCELVGQGIANIASGLFGGICVTGTVARTATNVRAGVHSPVSGMAHSLFLILFIVVAAPLASYIPLAVLAAVLGVVCWNMFERDAFATLLRASRGDAAVLLATFGITLFRGLTEAIVVGFALGSVLFIHRMSQTTALETHVPLVAEEDVPDDASREGYDETAQQDPTVVVYRISGAFFFGAAAAIGTVLERIGDAHRNLIIDFSRCRSLIRTGAKTIEGLAHKAAKRGVGVYLTGMSEGVRRELAAQGARRPLVNKAVSIDQALAEIRGKRPAPEAPVVVS